MKDIKTEVEELKKKLNNKLTDRLEELQITKQLKVLENELRKKKNDLFFDIAQVDVNTENKIKELTKKVVSVLDKIYSSNYILNQKLNCKKYWKKLPQILWIDIELIKNFKYYMSPIISIV